MLSKNTNGLTRVVEFAILFVVFITIFTVYIAIVPFTRPKITVNYFVQDLVALSEKFISLPGLSNGNKAWNDTSHLTQIGLAYHDPETNITYGNVISETKFNAVKNLTYEQFKSLIGFDREPYSYNITISYLNHTPINSLGFPIPKYYKSITRIVVFYNESGCRVYAKFTLHLW